MGHPVLLQRAEPVANPSAPEIRRIVADMFETMEDAPGVGLAAPQVHIPLRLFVFRVPQGRIERRKSIDEPAGAIPNTVLINPEIERIGDDIREDWEGCLSIPGLRALVPRHWRIRYHGVDLDGVARTYEATGFHAKVIQHEYDHLDGILYPMRITNFAAFGFNEELARVEAQGASEPASERQDQEPLE